MVRTQLVISLVLLSFLANAQFSDCGSAIRVTKPKYLQPVARDAGKVVEFSGHELGDRFYIEKEHKSVWYRIPVEADGLFTFTLTGRSDQEDWDFMLFKTKGEEDACKRIVSKEVRPIRTNMARNGEEQGVETGLKKGSRSPFEPAGLNPVFSQPCQVKKGDVLYLMTDQVKETIRGHTIEFNMLTSGSEMSGSNTGKPLIDDSVVIQKHVPNDKKGSEHPLVELIVLDQVTRDSLKGRLSIEYGTDSTWVVDDVSSVKVPLQETKRMVITAFAEGYLFKIVGYTMAKSGEAEDPIKIYLKRIQKGGRINLKDIRFKGNKDEILPSSRSSLQSLKEFIVKNKSLKVEIQGHVNGPGDPNKAWYRKLSKSRAKSVRQYLIDQGISKKRLKAKGYGNKEMIFPAPVNEKQHAANRRVEVKILSFDK